LVGNPNEQSFQGYKTQNYYEQPQRSGNVGQLNNYNQQAVNGPEMMNNYQGNGFRHEEAMFNPSGPGRGGSLIVHIFLVCLLQLHTLYSFFKLIESCEKKGKKENSLRCYLDMFLETSRKFKW